MKAFIARWKLTSQFILTEIKKRNINYLTTKVMMKQLKNVYLCLMAVTVVTFVTACKGDHEDNDFTLVKKITLNKETLTLKPEEKETLLATVTPLNANDPTIRWSSNNESVAKISQDGIVTALTKGTSTITVAAGNKTATCTMTVIERVPATITAEDVANALTGTNSDAIVIDGDLTLEYAEEVSLGADHTLTINPERTLTIIGRGFNAQKGAPYTLTVNGGGTLLMKGVNHSSFANGTLKLENSTVRVQNTGLAAIEANVYIGNNASLIIDAPECVTPIYISRFETLTVSNGGKLDINNFVNLAIDCSNTLLIDGGTVSINSLGRLNDDWKKEKSPLAIGLIYPESNLEIKNDGRLTSNVEGGTIFLFGKQPKRSGSKVKGARELFKTSFYTLNTNNEVEVGPADTTDALRSGRYDWRSAEKAFIWASVDYNLR